MCYFLFFGFPERYRYGDLPKHPPHIVLTAVVPASNDGTSWYWITSGMCACDLYQPSEKPPKLDQMRKRYLKKGWSEAKIERALQSRQSKPLKRRGLRNDMKLWFSKCALVTGTLHFGVRWVDGDPMLVPGTVLCVSVQDLQKEGLELPGEGVLLVQVSK